MKFLEYVIYLMANLNDFLTKFCLNNLISYYISFFITNGSLNLCDNTFIRAFKVVVLKSLAFSNSKNYFIYFNSTFYNIKHPTSMVLFLFFLPLHLNFLSLFFFNYSYMSVSVSLSLSLSLSPLKQ